MKTLTFLLIFIFSSISCDAQTNKDFTIYNAETMFLEEINSSGKILSSKPVGKKITIMKDDYFYSYRIIFTDESIKTQQLYLKFEGKENDKIKVKDDTGAIYYVEDNIIKSGILKIKIVNDPGHFLGFVIRNATKQKK